LRRFAAVLLLLALAAPAPGQTVTLPKEVRADVGRLAAIKIDWDGEDIRWVVPPELDAFREYDPDPKRVRLRVQGFAPGRHNVLAVSAKGGKLSEFAVCVVVIGKGPPTPPEPGPGPGPGPGPVPPAPTPVAGLKVLIVEESGDRAKLTPAQQSILAGKEMRDWLNANCSPDEVYKKGFAIWDKDTAVADLPKYWQDALTAGAGKALPWVVVMDGKGNVAGGFAMPADTAATIAALSKYLPKSQRKAG
jgi:hypothetical protein